MLVILLFESLKNEENQNRLLRPPSAVNMTITRHEVFISLLIEGVQKV